MIEEIEKIMDEIKYGYLDENGLNILQHYNNWQKEFNSIYHLLTPEELLDKKYGVCWDQVELERKLFMDRNVPVMTYFIYVYDGTNYQSHTFLTYVMNDKYYWFEHSWEKYKGVHSYDAIKDLLLDVKKKFISYYSLKDDDYIFVYKYEKPEYHISCRNFYKFCESGELIKLNEPLYFYHGVSKKANLEVGLLSLKYMYDNKMYDLFDENTDKYKKRIVDNWNIDKYKGREESSLTREEIMDALNIYRGKYGTSYIYFFRYPLKEELGSKIKKILKEKDIYCLNINDEEIQRNIKDIFYGYDESNSKNKLLDFNYYKNVSEKEYFSKYDDNLDMCFAKLNHISIAFINDYCPISFLKKVE